MLREDVGETDSRQAEARALGGGSEWRVVFSMLISTDGIVSRPPRVLWVLPQALLCALQVSLHLNGFPAPALSHS